jgi:hypothetical protein
MIEFILQAVSELSQSPDCADWTAERILDTAVAAAKEEHVVRGKGPPIARVDNTRFGFCIGETEDSIDVTMIAGEEILYDED